MEIRAATINLEVSHFMMKAH